MNGLPLLLLVVFQAPEQRALDNLAREVPRWTAETQCFSCHHNGDGARALYAAQARGWKVDPNALAATSRWLSQPERWDKTPGDSNFSDKNLARIQFASALAESHGAALIYAAQSLIPLQQVDGSFPVAAPTESAAAWGTPLATYMARRVLEKADAARFAAAIAKANQWFARMQPSGVLNAAVKLLALPQSSDCLKIVLAAQQRDGGWGNPLDTAIVLLALPPGDAAQRGRVYLISTQRPAGDWPAANNAQRISTTAWATFALLATGPR